MLIQNIKLAFRLLWRNPFFTIINLLGLSVGFASFLILYPYTEAELSSDHFHTDYKEIARLGTHLRWTDDNENWDEWYNASSFFAAGATVEDKFTEVTELTRVLPRINLRKNIQGSGPDVVISFIGNDNKKLSFREDKTVFAEPNFFDFFDFPLIKGSAGQVLTAPRSVVLSETCAKKYFGGDEPINQIIYLNDSIPLNVTGVFKDLPYNTHFDFDIMISIAGYQGIDVPSFDWMGYNYIKVSGGNFALLAENIKQRYEEIYGPKNPKVQPNAFLEPLTEIAYSTAQGNVFKTKSKTTLILLQVIAFVIIGLALINYITLYVNNLNKRMTELGTRKAVGATTRNIVLQFYNESTLINLLAFALAFTIVQLIGVAVVNLFGFYLISFENLSGETVLLLASMLIGAIIITGFYPAWLSSGNKPLELLKKLKFHNKPVWVNWIVTMQYSSAIILLIWVIAVYSQLKFILNKDLGFVEEGVIAISPPVNKSANFYVQLKTFLDKSNGINGVSKTSFSQTLPGDLSGSLSVQKSASTNPLALDISGGVDENFLTLYQIPLLAGRNFISDEPINKNAVLISEDAVKRIGFANPGEAIGRKLILSNVDNQLVEIIGVYKDYEFRPFLAGQREDGRGSILTYKNSVPYVQADRISLKIQLTHYDEVIGALKKLYVESFGSGEFDFTFVSDNIRRHYTSEIKSRNQIILFTIVAMSIASLGLLGMVTQKITEKTKEIGIRKILGARFYDIAKMLLTTTMIQLIIAMIVAIPVGNYISDQYLQKYSDKITLGWLHYVLPVIILVMIMFLTISTVLFRAGRQNPVDSLRYE